MKFRNTCGMDTFENEASLKAELAAIDTKIKRLNDQKITVFLKALGLDTREDIPTEYLQWKTILVILPNRKIANDIRPYKSSIERIVFRINPNAQQVHIYDLEDWDKAFRYKTQLQIRNLLKTSFGGVPRKRQNEDDQ